MINIDKQIEYWQQSGESNLETAELLIKNEKNTEGLFFCHLSIEKMLKALVVKHVKDIPPKSHDLFYLSEKAGIQINEEQSIIMEILMKYQLEGRYPQNYPKSPSNEKAQEYLINAKELVQWFKMKL